MRSYVQSAVGNFTGVRLAPFQVINRHPTRGLMRCGVTRDKLAALYAPFNDRLYTMLGNDLLRGYAPASEPFFGTFPPPECAWNASER